MTQKIAVFGGGIGGLTVAHQLSKFPQYEINIYEKKDVIGGLARSSRDDTKCVSEYCWRAYFDFYDNLFGIMREIPLIEDPSKSVIDNLTNCSNTNFSDKEFTLKDKIIGVKKILYGVTSCDGRLDLLDNISWWKSLEGTDNSNLYRATSSWLGGNRYRCSYKSVIKVGMEMDIIPKLYHNYMNYVTTQPTSEAWFRHWQKHLTDNNVKIHFNTQLEKVDIVNNKIISATLSTGEVITADYYVFALPVEILDIIIARTPELQQGQLLNINELKHLGFQMQLSFQVYFDRSISLGINPGRGKNNTFFIIDSPWDVVVLQYDKIYKGVELCKDISSAKGGWSVAVCTPDSVGIVYGKPFYRCTYDEIITELWQQMYTCKSLQKKIYEENGYTMEEDMVIKWSPMWPGYAYIDGMIKTNEPKFTNNAKTGALRPSIRTHIPNLFIATGYCREAIDIFSTDAAASSGKSVAYAIHGPELEQATVRRRPIIFAPFRAIDEVMFSNNLPNINPAIIFSFIFFVIVLVTYYLYQKIKR
uniref:Amine oxidase domain-containing protein n=1 Tax=viral metagenome TaxID=1070528 RepID=A0A6C0C9A0_9ZZZZ